MSDVAIRFDGLVLGIVLFAGLMLLGIVLVTTTLLALFSKPPRGRFRRLIKRAAALALAHAVALAMLIGYLINTPAPAEGPNRIDWLAIPSALVTLGGLALLFWPHRRPRDGV